MWRYNTLNRTLHGSTTSAMLSPRNYLGWSDDRISYFAWAALHPDGTRDWKDVL